jgi:hypothetical protein
VLSDLASDLKFSYLDDLNMGGPAIKVSNDVQKVISASKKIGLTLNFGKCELISKGPCTLVSPLGSFYQVSPDQADLLGAPLLVGPAMDEALRKIKESLSRATKRLSLISAHDALVILRSSLGAPKVTYTLRAAPCAEHPTLTEYDGILRQALSVLINVDMSDDQWLQANLPVRMGGLGVRGVSLLASSAYLASAAVTRNLQDQILHQSCHSDDSEYSRVLSSWSSVSRHDCPV